MKAIQKIRDEHRSISAVLHALKQLARPLLRLVPIVVVD